MEENQKKVLSIVLAVVCVAAAGFIFFSTRGSEDKLSVFAGQPTWVICTNPKCNTTYEMDLKEYYAEMEKKGPLHMGMQGITCQKCAQLTVFKAIKCPKCSTVFRERAAGPEDYHDRCPKCRFSKSEEGMKK